MEVSGELPHVPVAPASCDLRYRTVFGSSYGFGDGSKAPDADVALRADSELAMKRALQGGDADGCFRIVLTSNTERLGQASGTRLIFSL